MKVILFIVLLLDGSGRPSAVMEKHEFNGPDAMEHCEMTKEYLEDVFTTDLGDRLKKMSLNCTSL